MHTRRSGLHPALMQGQPHIIDRIVDSAGALQRVLRAEPQRVALDVLVDGAVSLARRALAAAAPAIEVRHEPHPYMLEVDAARLQRAIAALIVSAVKGRAPSAPKGRAPSAPKGKAPSAPWVAVISHGSAAGADIRITQAGAEVDPRALGDSVRHIDSNPSTLDLQMSLARQLVELQGGSIVVRAAGGGVQPSLVVRLPAKAVKRFGGKPTAFASPAPLGTRLDGVHILLVEDDPDALDFLALILRQTGATVSAFPLAAPAFDFYSRSEQLPDIVVSDIAMPVEDGYSLMWRLRAWELNHGRIPVPAVAVSAFARDEDVQRAHAHGFDVHVPKPVDASQLISLIAAWTRSSP
ncbi:MAG: response regulator [Burkholderiales bacterium]